MLHLSHNDRERLNQAQRVLLASLRYGDVQDWLRAAAGAAQTLLKGDHAYAFQLGPGTTTLIPHTVDSAFGDTAEEYLVDTANSSMEPRALPLPARMHRDRVAGGSGAYHEQDLLSRAEVEASPYFQEIAAPFGLRYATGLSAVEGATETALCVAFESRDASGFTVESTEKLNLLTPAFEAGLRHLQQFGTLGSRLRRVVDLLSDAVFVFSMDGREVYRNRALRQLLRGLHDPDPLCRSAIGVALSVSENHMSARPSQACRTIQGETGTYVLRGTWAGRLLGNETGVLVTVEPGSPYPSLLALQSAHNLTPRQAEVALLVARGMKDAQIADELSISVHTVRRHVSAVRARLGVDSRAAVADRLVRGSAPPPDDAPSG